jgi:hypothetical protein
MFLDTFEHIAVYGGWRATASGGPGLIRRRGSATRKGIQRGRSLGIASHWPFDQRGRFLPEHTTAVSLLDRLLHHASVVVTSGDSYRMREARAKGGNTLNNS